MKQLDQIPEVQIEELPPEMDRKQLDMLMMVDEGEGDASLVRELFGLFKTESEEKLQELSRACAENDETRLLKIVHFIAGSSSNLGLLRLACFYRALERALEAGRFNDLAHCEEPIRSAFEGACEVFRAEFKF